MKFITGLLVGNLVGFLIATLCHLASEIDDDDENK